MKSVAIYLNRIKSLRQASVDEGGQLAISCASFFSVFML